MVQQSNTRRSHRTNAVPSVPGIGHNTSCAQPPGPRPTEMVRVADLVPNPHNPRRHSDKQRRALAKIIRRVGFTSAIVIDAGNAIICGELRVEAAKDVGIESVPAVRVGDLDEADIRALIIADNRIAELAEWDTKGLKAQFDYLVSIDYDVDLTGFEPPEIDIIIADGDNGYDARSDDVPLVDETTPPVSRTGDLWLLGDRHRLSCGDALDNSAYELLLGSQRAQMVFTDPPYNVQIDGNVCGSGRIKHGEFVMASGEMSDAEFTAFLHSGFRRIGSCVQDGAIIFVCMDWRHLRHVLAAGHSAFDDLINLCVWNKSNGGMGSLYRSKHELIFVFKQGQAAHINNVELGKHGRNRTNVWDYAGVNSFDPDRRGDLELHPTVKPAAMVADAMLDCSMRGGIILDPFAGSGTLFIAAEEVGRIGYGMELDPRYVDVAIRRWESFSGKTATHADTGMSFAEVAATRLSAAENSESNIKTSEVGQ